MIKSSFERLSISALSCACAAVLLAACGGGGSSSTPADTAAATSAAAAEGVATPALLASADTNSNTTTSTSTDSNSYPTPSTTVTPAATGTTPAPSPAPAPAPAPAASHTPAPAPAPASSPSPAPAPAPAPAAAVGPYGQDASKYTLVFADEFDNGYNTKVWNDTVWYESSNATKNYTVENGALKIWPQRDASGNFFNRTIDTDGKYYQTYGYFEIEAKLPYGKGTWPAFWLFNHDDATKRPEIDILEAYAGGGANSGWGDGNMKPTAFASTIWPVGIQSGPNGGTKTFQNLGDLSAGFHKYAVKWEPSKITFYFDGKEMYSSNASMGSRMYILLDLWYGSASGTPDNSTPQGKGNAYEVNYVRAWQFK